jgi:hypothetical protein
MIRQVQSDTQPSRSLLDSDFGVDLSPGRPFIELLPVSYVIVKSKFAKVAADISHAVETPAFADVFALDTELHKVHREIPPSLRFVSVQPSIIMACHLPFLRVSNSKYCTKRHATSCTVVIWVSRLARKSKKCRAMHALTLP